MATERKKKLPPVKGIGVRIRAEQAGVSVLDITAPLKGSQIVVSRPYVPSDDQPMASPPTEAFGYASVRMGASFASSRADAEVMRAEDACDNPSEIVRLVNVRGLLPPVYRYRVLYAKEQWIESFVGYPGSVTLRTWSGMYDTWFEAPGSDLRVFLAETNLSSMVERFSRKARRGRSTHAKIEADIEATWPLIQQAIRDELEREGISFQAHPSERSTP